MNSGATTRTAFVPSQDILELSMQQTISEDECMEMLISQIKFYFSRENLAKDMFMLSKMTPNMQLPIQIIFSFRRIQSITNDLALFVKALKACDLFIDEEFMLVGPRVEIPKKKMLLMRQLPPSTTEADFRALFDDFEHKPTGVQKLNPTMWQAMFTSDAHPASFVAKHSEITVGNQAVLCSQKAESPLQKFIEQAKADGLTVAPVDTTRAVPAWVYRGHRNEHSAQRKHDDRKPRNVKEHGQSRQRDVRERHDRRDVKHEPRRPTRQYKDREESKEPKKTMKDFSFPALGSGTPTPRREQHMRAFADVVKSQTKE
ncbi:La domain [Carpediemonas membranifera]|uniref:La domain n=1 Tax=Carpediemonas membranifera TaxID=201153 RepID=A0A8J6E1U4_9EUKA|nr:La domain [Carpediemonas membranifera]|eukprot:KAG9393491.1 La domain [Carpediemonas membranifera]